MCWITQPLKPKAPVHQNRIFLRPNSHTARTHDTVISVVFITPCFSSLFQLFPIILSSLDVGLGPLLTVAR